MVARDCSRGRSASPGSTKRWAPHIGPARRSPGLLDRAGLKPGTVELVFTGADHGVEKGYEHDYARSLDAYRGNSTGGDPRLRDERPAARTAAWLSGSAPRARLVRNDTGQVAHSASRPSREPFTGYQQAVAYRYRTGPEDPGIRVRGMRPRALMLPPGFPDFLTRRRMVERGICASRAARGRDLRHPLLGSSSGSTENGVMRCWIAPLGTFAWRRWSLIWDATTRANTSCPAGRPTPTATFSRSNSPGTGREWATISCRP